MARKKSRGDAGRLSLLLMLLALMPSRPGVTRAYVCDELGISEKVFYRMLKAVGDTGFMKIRSSFGPDGKKLYYIGEPELRFLKHLAHIR